MLSICIVTYNNEKDIIPCLDSLPWKTLTLEVRLVDNNSNDQTRQHVKDYIEKNPHHQLHTYWNHFNHGYSTAMNQALSGAQGDYILLLGPDTRIFPSSLTKMIKFLNKNPQVGLVAPQLIKPNMQIQPSCRLFPNYGDVFCELSGLPRLLPSSFQAPWKMVDFDHNHQKIVEQPEATCLLTHRQALEDVGFMDERFPIFFNDVDWCRRYQDKHWKVVFFPEAKVYHDKGSTIYQQKTPMVWKSHQGFYRYFQKYYDSFGEKIINQLLGLGLIIVALFRSLLLLFFNSKNLRKKL